MLSTLAVLCDTNVHWSRSISHLARGLFITFVLCFTRPLRVAPRLLVKIVVPLGSVPRVAVAEVLGRTAPARTG